MFGVASGDVDVGWSFYLALMGGALIQLSGGLALVPDLRAEQETPDTTVFRKKVETEDIEEAETEFLEEAETEHLEALGLKIWNKHN